MRIVPCFFNVQSQIKMIDISDIMFKFDHIDDKSALVIGLVSLDCKPLPYLMLT